MSRFIAIVKAEPALVISLVGALLALGATFGLRLSTDQTGAILAVVNIGLGLMVRQAVVPVASLRRQTTPPMLTGNPNSTVAPATWTNVPLTSAWPQVLVKRFRAEKPSDLGGRLGRHVEHDERSRAYAIPEQTAALQSRRWERRSPVFDQGQLGSCTGNAAAGWVATDNAGRKGKAGLTEATAVRVYEQATRLDGIPGTYPPDDTGSSGLGAAKALKAVGLCTSYRHCFSLRAVLTALQSGPVMIGIAWRTGCDTPDHNGLIHYTGSVRGGHEILADEIHVNTQLIGFTNSWGTGWGVRGRFYMSWADLEIALRDHGDATVPT